MPPTLKFANGKSSIGVGPYNFRQTSFSFDLLTSADAM